MRRLFGAVFCMTALLVHSPATLAHAPFKKGLQKKYDFKSVSCYTCHARKADIAAKDLDDFARNSRSFRNSFGSQLGKLLAGKNTTQRLMDVKKLDLDDPKKIKVINDVTSDFLEALKKVELVKSPSGPTYGELLKMGILAGVKSK